MFEIHWTEEKVNRIWAYYAENRSIQSQYFSFHSGIHILKYLRRHLPLPSMESILDFGCGPGYMMEHLLRLGTGKCYGFDFSKEAVDMVNQKFKRTPSFAGAFCSDQLPSPLSEGSMDLVIAVEVIEHLNDMQLSDMLKEIFRLLRPSGYLVITTPNREDLEANKTICPECGCIFHRWQHVRPWDRQSLDSWLEKFSFHTILIEETFFQSRSAFLLSTALNLLKRVTNRGVYQSLPHLILIAQR